MIHFAPRCPESYFLSLNALRDCQQQHRLICGSCAGTFFYALNNNTQSLSFCSLDRQTLLYNRLLITLARKAPSLRDFAGYVSKSIVHTVKPFSASLHTTWSNRVWQILQDPQLYACYVETIGRFTTIPGQPAATHGDTTILFSGTSLKPLTFSWRFGEGCFESEESFSALKQAIERCQIQYFQISLYDLPSSFFPADTLNYVIAHAADSPFSIRGDPLIQSVTRVQCGEVHMLTWSRAVSLHAPASFSAGIQKLIDDDMRTGYAHGIGITSTLLSKHFESIQSLRGSKIFGAPLLLVNLDGLSIADTIAQEFFTSIIPCYQKVAFFGSGIASAFLRSCEENNLLPSYVFELLTEEHGAFYARCVKRPLS